MCRYQSSGIHHITSWDLETSSNVDTLATAIAVNNNVPSVSIHETIADWLVSLQVGWNLRPFIVLNKWQKENSKHPWTEKDAVYLRYYLKQLHKDIGGKYNHLQRLCFMIHQRGFVIGICMYACKKKRGPRKHCWKSWKTNKYTWL